MNTDIENVSEVLFKRFDDLDNKADILKSKELKILYSTIPLLPEIERAIFGKKVNDLSLKLKSLIEKHQQKHEAPLPIDITAPFDINQNLNNANHLLTSDNGSQHPLMRELDTVLDIFYRMGFSAIESRIIDDDFHMFESLNFPDGHPARDDYDTFMTEDKLIAPAHTSSMQNRVIQQNKSELEHGKTIAYLIPGAVFRNEDVDSRHDHTFYQVEGVYVGKNVNAGNLMATLRTFLEEYFDQKLEIKSQPFYFPFTEPSFEFALSCPFCNKKGCSICSNSGFIELLGCGMIHPNVLSQVGIDPDVYSGFAFGFGLDRLVMMKYDIEDVRNLKSSKLEFLRQFS
ncbi:MAG TPA: phenylalanine--tRNA ligase subunit alpha [Candidatus Dormibacteraeota bacterium]|nr:phenylalanine--tRNA ligase subunit alpha [Candidatus Dormibacteraeota bacterium]